ncbi:hypothetical protein HDU81_006390 [Chytriomyces hyalinus]|nr:hypothetical protein HDU81_006390 [Chytriomyces hyalinus]
MGNVTTLEDPDLMPSIKDWELLCKFLTNGTFSLLNYLIPRGFLESLFSQPPGIRLTWGAIAAYLSTPRLSNETCASYFSRAQKAVSRCFHQVSLESMQACVLISYFVLVSGRPRAAAPFHNQSIKLMYALQLEIDPDNILVAAAHPFMSEQEKQARRITFWVTFYCVRLMQSIVVRSHGIRQITIKSDNIKPAKAIYYDKYNGQIEATATVCHLVTILDAIELVKSHHFTVPQTVSEVIYPSSFEALSSHLNTLRYQLPLHLLCNNFSCPPSVFLDNIANDTSHTRKSVIIETLYDAIMVSMTFNTAKCILYRPQLYLTHFLKLDGPALLDNPKAISTLLTAIDESMKSARRITQLNSWLVMNPNWSVHLHFVFSAFSLFEACVVLWFLTCRTRSFWFWNGAPFSSASSPVVASPYLTNQMGDGGGSLSLSMEERRAIRSELLDAIISLKAIEVSFAMAGPLRECVEAMVVEMSHVEEQILLGVPETEGMSFPGGDFSFRNVGSDLDQVLIGMKSMAIGDDGRYHLPKPDSTCRVVAGYATQTLSPLQPHQHQHTTTFSQQSVEILEPLSGKPHTCNNPIPILLVRRLRRLEDSYNRTVVEERAFDVDEISVETAETIAKERHEEQQEEMRWVYDEAMRIRRLMDEFGIVELDLKGVVA